MLLSKESYYHSRSYHDYKTDRNQFLKLFTRRLNRCILDLNRKNIIMFSNIIIFSRNIFYRESILEYIYTSTKQLNFNKDIIYILYYLLIDNNISPINNSDKYESYKYIYSTGLPSNINNEINQILDDVYK